MDKTYRAVIDTNVLISGLFGIHKSPSAHILDAIRSHKIILISSPKILEEVGEVISRERIVARTHMTKEDKTKFMEMLIEHCEITAGKQLEEGVSRDIKDNMILACGLEAQAEYIVTVMKIYSYSKRFTV